MRFTRPIEESRLAGAPRFECWSPKHRRHLSLYDRWAFEQWVLLEADPAVVSFCARPYWTDLDGEQRLVDFWARREENEYALVIVSDEEVASGLTHRTAARKPALEIRWVKPLDLRAKETLIANWHMLLSDLRACLKSSGGLGGSPDHELNHGDSDPGLGGFTPPFEVFAQAA